MDVLGDVRRRLQRPSFEHVSHVISCLCLWLRTHTGTTASGPTLLFCQNGASTRCSATTEPSASSVRRPASARCPTEGAGLLTAFIPFYSLSLASSFHSSSSSHASSVHPPPPTDDQSDVGKGRSFILSADFLRRCHRPFLREVENLSGRDAAYWGRC